LYRFYILDSKGAFVDVIVADCADDEAAHRAARGRLRGAPGIEIWQGARFVGAVRSCRAA
jgi:hypothetical protein